MMVNSQGHLYAAPPGAVLAGSAAALQTSPQQLDALAGSGPTEASAPVEQEADSSGEEDTALQGAQSVNTVSAGTQALRYQGIFGADTRREIRSTPKYPFSAAGHLMFTSAENNQRFQCSGTLVGTYVVLTAAHCVVARSGEVQQDMQFTVAETSHNHGGLGAAKGVRVYFNADCWASP